MKNSLNLLALRSIAVLAAATAMMSAAQASPPRSPLSPQPRTAPIVVSAGTTVFNPDVSTIEPSGAST